MPLKQPVVVGCGLRLGHTSLRCAPRAVRDRRTREGCGGEREPAQGVAHRASPHGRARRDKSSKVCNGQQGETSVITCATPETSPLGAIGVERHRHQHGFDFDHIAVHWSYRRRKARAARFGEATPSKSGEAWSGCRDPLQQGIQPRSSPPYARTGGCRQAVKRSIEWTRSEKDKRQRRFSALGSTSASQARAAPRDQAQILRRSGCCGDSWSSSLAPLYQPGPVGPSVRCLPPGKSGKPCQVGIEAFSPKCPARFARHSNLGGEAAERSGRNATNQESRARILSLKSDRALAHGHGNAGESGNWRERASAGCRHKTSDMGEPGNAGRPWFGQCGTDQLQDEQNRHIDGRDFVRNREQHTSG